ncbi:MAG: Sir2 family NAD-dependent protein deacetylase [Singulisphaera sp.]
MVWFGESLPGEVWLAAESAVRAADLVLVVGTSAVVYPAAGLVATGRRAGAAVVEVNLEPTPASGSVDIGLYGKAGEILPRLVTGEFS